MTRFRRLDIMKHLDTVMADVCEARFTSRPTALQKQVNEFVVISLPVRMVDRGAYQETFCRVALFARDRANGQENTKGLEDLQEKVVGKFPIVSDFFSAIDPVLIPSGADTIGFHSLMVQAKLIINQ